MNLDNYCEEWLDEKKEVFCIRKVEFSGRQNIGITCLPESTRCIFGDFVALLKILNPIL